MGRRKNVEKKIEEKKTEVIKTPQIKAKTKVAERNEKFMDFYNDIKDSEEFVGLKSHKKVKYLSEQFRSKSQLNMPVGTIYKLLRSEHIQTPVSEQANLEE